MLFIESKRKHRGILLKQHPSAIIADVTSHAADDLIKLSPFYPHGDIPVPFSEGVTATCVEAVWQGLKVFESVDVDANMFRNDTMKSIKRTVRRFGRPLGHRQDYREELAEEYQKPSGNSQLLKAAETVGCDFEKDVVDGLLHASENEYSFRKHIKELHELSLIDMDDFTFVWIHA